MKVQSTFALAASIFLTVCGASASFAQTNKAAETSNQDAAVVQSSRAPNNATEFLALEINYLRQSLQILNNRLREVGEKVATGGRSTANSRQNRIITNFDLLSRAEQRAETLRKQLIELVEKETSIKARIIQLEEDARQENIERTIPTLGSTRAPEIRENRRKSLEAERTGLQSLLSRIEQSRVRLEEDLRQADLIVVTLRQRLLPLIEREIQNISPE